MFVIYSARKEGVLWFTCTQWPHPFACGDLNSLRRCTTLLILVHGDHNYPFEGISMKSITLQSLVSYMVDLRMESQRLMWWSLPFEEIAHVGQIDVCRVWYVVLWGWNPIMLQSLVHSDLRRSHMESLSFLRLFPSQYGCCVCLDCRCACPSL